MPFARVVRCDLCDWSEETQDSARHDQLLNGACPDCGKREQVSRAKVSDRPGALVFNGKRFDRVGTRIAGQPTGFFRRRKGGQGVDLLDLLQRQIGVINCYGVLARATPLPDGRTWFSYADIPEIGAYDYGQTVADSHAALAACGVERAHE